MKVKRHLERIVVAQADDIVWLQRRLGKVKDDRRRANRMLASAETEVNRLQRALDEKVVTLFGMTADEVGAMKAKLMEQES